MTTVTNTDAPSQLDQQLELLCSFNVQIPCNPQGEFSESSFKTLLQSLNTNQICDSLAWILPRCEFKEMERIRPKRI